MTAILPEQPFKAKLIHIGRLFIGKGGQFLFLKQIASRHFQWYYVDDNFNEISTEIFADSVQEAMRLAFQTWKQQYFTTLHCGFRYTLPERDEHGINALFHQMAASISSFNGVYFDEELGHTCFVQNASLEARELWRKLNLMGKL